MCLACNRSAVYASTKTGAVVVPAEARVGRIASTILIGATAGVCLLFERLG